MPQIIDKIKRNNKQQDIKRLILDTALRLFTENGYFNTTVHDIRREADISIGSIYHYFKNKEAVAKALYDNLIENMTGTIEEIKNNHGTTQSRCRAIVSCFINMTDSSPETMKYILYARHQEFMPDEKPICSSRPFEMMKEIVEDGIETGEIRKMTTIVAATSLFGGVIRLIHLMLDGVLEGPLSLYFEEAWKCAWAGVAA